MHNEILNAFMMNNNKKYISNGIIDFQLFYSDYKQTLKDLNYPYKDVDQILNQKISQCFDRIIKLLNSLSANEMHINAVFSQIEHSLYDDASFKKEDAKFMSIFIKNVILLFPMYIPLDEIPSYSEKINNVLKQSELSESNILMCKSFFQTMVCSCIYWGCSTLK